MKAWRAVQYIVFTLLALAGLVTTIAAVGAVITTAEENGSAPMIAGAAAALLTIVMLTGISIGGLVRLRDQKRLTFPTAMMMMVFTALAGFTFSAMVSDRDGYYDLYAILFGTAALLGTGTFFLGRHADKISPDVLLAHKNTLLGERFYADKGEWAWDAAYREYFGDNEERQLPDSVVCKLYEYAAMPIVCYVCWLVRRELLTDEFYELIPQNVTDEIKQGRGDPVSMLSYNDYTLTADMLTRAVFSFTGDYYQDSLRREKHASPYDAYSQSYQFDYFDIIGGGKKYYVNEFSWESQLKLEQVLDSRFEEYDISGIWDYAEHTVVSSTIFGDITVTAAPNVDEGYIQKCIAHITAPDDELEEKIYRSLYDAAKLYGEISSDRESVFAMLADPVMTVYVPKGDEPAYSLTGGEETDDDLCGSLTIRGSYVSEFMTDDEIICPWSEKFEMKMLFDDSTDQNTRRVGLIPVRMGGSSDADNTFTAPVVIADFKDRCDRRIDCLRIQGLHLRYDCQPIYKDDRAVGVKVTADADDGRRVFSDQIEKPI